MCASHFVENAAVGFAFRRMDLVSDVRACRNKFHDFIRIDLGSIGRRVGMGGDPNLVLSSRRTHGMSADAPMIED